MSLPFETLEKQQLGRVLVILRTNNSLHEKGEQLPATLRQLGIGHTLMKYYKDSRELYTTLLDEIREFDSTLLPLTTNPSTVATKLNSLPAQTEIMLFEHLFSFAEEFRKVAKVLAKAE